MMAASPHLPFRPLAFRDERPRQPVYVHAEIVQIAEENIGRDRARVHDVQRGFAFGFDDDAREQGREALLAGCDAPAGLFLAVLGQLGLHQVQDGLRGQFAVGGVGGEGAALALLLNPGWVPDQQQQTVGVKKTQTDNLFFCLGGSA